VVRAAAAVRAVALIGGEIYGHEMKRAKMHLPPEPPKPRNPVARSPLLGKGGAHGKTTGARRREANVLAARLKRDPEAQP
jgi:hypothetical protein